MIYINKENPVKVTENSCLADRIRGSRRTFQCTEEMAKRTQDIFEKSGCEKVTYPKYTKFAVIDTPVASTKEEMQEVMTGYYNGDISKEEIKDFFMEYCTVMYAKDENTILNVYEGFLDENYRVAVRECFQEGKDIAEREGKAGQRCVYYDADYYYKSEEIHELLKEAAKERGEKYGVEVDASKRDESFQQDYLTGTPNFNDKWNWMAVHMPKVGRLMDIASTPPEGFSFFFTEGGHMGTEGSLLIISGNDWTEKVDVPFEIPTAGKESRHYFYLSDLFQVNDGEENSKCYNDFLDKLVINRIAPGVVIKRR